MGDAMAAGKWMFAAVVLTLAAILSAEPNPTTRPTTVSVADIPALIQALGSDSYKTRQQAQDELVQLGLAAKPALEQAARTADSPEVRAVPPRRFGKSTTTSRIRQRISACT